MKVKSSSTSRSRCQRNSVSTPSTRLRIVRSDAAASSVGQFRCPSSASVPDAAPATSSRRQPQTVPDVTAQPRTARRQREAVRRSSVLPAAAPTSRQLSTVPDDDLALSDTSQSNRTGPLANRQLSASRGPEPVCPDCRVPSQMCQCPESNICPLGLICSRDTTVSGDNPVRHSSRGQQDAVPDVTPVNPRRRERDTIETARVAAARPSHRSIRRAATSQHSMSLRDSNVVDPPEVPSPPPRQVRYYVAAPHLNSRSSIPRPLNTSMALSLFISTVRARGTATHELTGQLAPTVFSIADLITSEADDLGGMSKEEIYRLPIRQVDDSTISSHPCIICLKDFEQGDMLRVMPCHHESHQRCLDQWLAIKRNCPVCRKVL